MNTNLILAGLLSLGIVLVFYGLSRGIVSRTTVGERLSQYGTRPRTLEEIEMSQPFSERVLLPLIRGMSQFIIRFTPQQNTEALQHNLELAGNPHDWSPSDFLGVRGLAAVFVAALGLALFWAMHSETVVLVLSAAVGGILGFYLPGLWLGLEIRKRQHEIQKGLPDALDLLTISVEAGLAFDSAMAKVAEKWDNELSRAFARVIAEIRVGKLRREALRDMAARMEVRDVSTFVAAVIQADQLGVSISRVLRIQSEQMRIKRRQRAEERANQAPVKMLIPLAFLIFPSIFLVVLGPSALTFLKGGLLP